MYGIESIRAINAYRVELHRKAEADKHGKAVKELRVKAVAAGHARAKASAKYV